MSASVPPQGLKAAIAKDEEAPVSENHPLISPPRSHLETDVLYNVAPPEECNIPVLMEIIVCIVIILFYCV